MDLLSKRRVDEQLRTMTMQTMSGDKFSPGGNILSKFIVLGASLLWPWL